MQTPFIRASRGEGFALVSHLGRSGVISAQHLGKVRRVQEDRGTPSPAASRPHARGAGAALAAGLGSPVGPPRPWWGSGGERRHKLTSIHLEMIPSSQAGSADSGMAAT